MIVPLCTAAGYALGGVIVCTVGLARPEPLQGWPVVRVLICATLLGMFVGVAVVNP